MKYPNTTDTAIGRGLAFLQSVQLEHGGFESFACNQNHPDPTIAAPPTTVIPSLVLTALTTVDHADVAPIKKELAAWLLSQKSPTWTFPYWSIAADKAYDRLLSANLHSTFLALTALYSYNPESITVTALGNIARLLINAESDVGGPYYTYAHIIARTTRPQIDIATNSTISHFLSQVAEPLPKLVAHIRQSTEQHTFTSRLFTSRYATLYQIASVVTTDQQQKIAAYIVANARSGSWGNALDNAFAIATLAKLNAAIPPTAIKQLLQAQQSDGSWEAHPCCIAPDAQSYGSTALTTAIALEAISNQHTPTATSRQKTKLGQTTQPDTATTIHKAVLGIAKQEIRKLNAPLRNHCLRMIDHISRGDENREIVLMGYFFNQSLCGPRQLPFDQEFLIHLGIANLYNWMAYSIYDDFLDSEGDPQLISVANVAMRYSLEHFRQALPEHISFQQTVSNFFDIIDTANAWEVERCRFPVKNGLITIGTPPRYGRRSRLAERSCSHSLPAIAILAKADIDAPAAIACYTAFMHYLIARQLNDDMHDWEEDVAAGRITYVVGAILEELHIQPGTTKLAPLMAAMRQQFWDHTLERICKDIMGHTARGRRAAARSQVLEEQNIIVKLLDSLERIALHSIEERTKADSFLDAYRTSP
jgi:hypothetical protein